MGRERGGGAEMGDFTDVGRGVHGNRWKSASALNRCWGLEMA
jgi:hypothetical protein